MAVMQRAGALAPAPVRWPILPEAAAFAQFRRQYPTDAVDSRLWPRWARAAHLFQTGGVSPDRGGYRTVESQYSAGERYAVTLTPDGGRCECGDAVWRTRSWCKHVIAVFIARHVEQPQQQATA